MKNRGIRRWLGCIAVIMMAFSGQVEASSPPFKDVNVASYPHNGSHQPE
jgi:hypothetical protein